MISINDLVFRPKTVAKQCRIFIKTVAKLCIIVIFNVKTRLRAGSPPELCILGRVPAFYYKSTVFMIKSSFFNRKASFSALWNVFYIY